MKAIVAAVAALIFAAPAFAQYQSGTREPSANPNPGMSNSDAARTPTEMDRQKNQDSASGAALTGKVKSALANDVGLRTVTGINVDSDNGVVTLKGKVDSASQKDRAELIAKRVGGVKSVNNQLQVSGG
jgi:hyperosmotically inducible protein